MGRKRFKMSALCLCIILSLIAISGCKKSGSVLEADKQLNQRETDEDKQAVEPTEAIRQVISFPLPNGPEDAGVYIEPIPDIPDDFIRGMDTSAVLVLENSGVKFYNFEGEEQDVFMTLAQAGVNYIRLRVWNDPYDKNGNGYGGGNNDVPTAIALGKRASKYGMKVCIDFHYSDFWADPKRQHVPKAWKGMNIEEKSKALYEFTKTSLSMMLDEGVNVGMVQIGNEINNGMSGEVSHDNVMKLLQSGSRAVREISQKYGKDIQIAVHYTNIEDSMGIDKIAARLADYGIDYDIFALSYYPFWDGSIENMKTVAKNLIEKHGKKVVIAETSYPYTSEDGDGSGNSVSGRDDTLVEGYPASVQGQASMIRDICAAAHEVGVMGIFYWEGTWIPVGKPTEDNSPIWEKYGSGWASSYAADYDPLDAGLYYGGCSWDNQAMFDFDGYPLESLKVFRCLKYGTRTPLEIVKVPDIYLTYIVGDNIVLPDMVDVIYNIPSHNQQVSVSWDETELANVDAGAVGNYTVTGTIENGMTVTCHVEVKMKNYVNNPSFEDSDTSMWKVSYVGDLNPTDYQVKSNDAYTGNIAFHFWSEADMEFSIEQEITDLEPGTYQLSVYAQGGDVKEGSVMELYAITGGKEQKVSFMVTTYADWKNPTIPEIQVTDGTLTIGARVKCNAYGWGTLDDFTLYKISD